MTHSHELPQQQEFNDLRLLDPETQRVIDEVAILDPELLATPETRRLVEIGARFIREVTLEHGSPDAPLWHEGTEDQTMMVYHNGESEVASGHTSIGADGVGVPRMVLVISAEINRRAGREVVGPFQRALLFASATAHDRKQLCGRSVKVANGDEEQSANILMATLIQEGFSEGTAAEGGCYVRSTMYDPDLGAHVIDYAGQTPQVILGQQIMGGADLVSPATLRGALGSSEWTLEESGMNQKGRRLHTELSTQGLAVSDIPDLAHLLNFVEATPLKQYFTTTLRGQARWVRTIRYSDNVIRDACGAGIDDMFPYRMQTADTLEQVADILDAGGTMYAAWRMCGAGARN